MPCTLCVSRHGQVTSVSDFMRERGLVPRSGSNGFRASGRWRGSSDAD